MFLPRHSFSAVIYTILPIFSLWSLNQPILIQTVDLPKIFPLTYDKRIITASTGQPIALRCPVNTKGDPRIYVEWSKGGGSLYLEERYADSDRKILRIRNVTTQDEGLYTCSVINGHGTVSVNFYLMVNSPRKGLNYLLTNHSSVHMDTTNPTFSRPNITREHYLHQSLKEESGGQVELHCAASGYPAPRIFWIKDGELLMGKVNISENRETHSALILSKLKKLDRGSYRCVAVNELGRDHIDFSLDVRAPLFPPEIESLDISSSKILIGQKAMLTCKGRNNPNLKLHIKWMKTISEDESHWSRTFHLGSKNYRPLDADEDPIIGKNGIFRSELLVSNATVQDSGTYICVAVNDKGYRFKNVSLKVTQANRAFPASYLPSEKPSVLVLVILCIAVILAPVISVMFLCCKCQTNKKIQSVQSSMEAQSLTNFSEPKLYQRNITDNSSYNSQVTYEPFVKPQSTKLTSSHTSKAYDCSDSLS